MIVEPFAGPGGWDHALTTWPDLHDQLIGYELDRWACATRAAAGHRTIRADVGDYDLHRLARADIEGLIGSPPCPTFSLAGKGGGRAELAQLIAAAHDGRMLYDTDDPRTSLVLEPIRWARWLRPRWVALEQVPPALPVWEATAHHLRTLGYATWVGVLNAADYGVPQTRRRAILIASLDHQPHRPPPTHQRHPDGMFALQPWVTMAAALGWGETRRPSTTLVGASGDGGRTPLDGGSNSRKARLKRVDAGEFVLPAWAHARPATTIVGSFSPDTVAAPGWRGPGDGPRQNTPGSITITAADALRLQSFPADYPVAGPRSAVFLQIGNAVPPGLARHVLAMATRRPLPVATTTVLPSTPTRGDTAP